VIFKRGKWYWIDSTVEGVRYRQPLKTTNWQKAKQEEKKVVQQALAGTLSRKTEGFARLGFSDAVDQFLIERKPEIAPASYKKEKQLFAKPKLYFGAKPLRKIETQDLLDYRTDRLANKVGSVLVNMEMTALGRLLKKARRWHVVAAEIKPLRQQASSVGRALEPGQKEKLLKTARTKPEWKVLNESPPPGLVGNVRNPAGFCISFHRPPRFFLFGSFSFFPSRRLFHRCGSTGSRIGPVHRFLFELVVFQTVRKSDAFPIKLMNRTMMG